MLSRSHTEIAPIIPYIFHLTGMCSYIPYLKKNSSTINIYHKLPAITLIFAISIATIAIFIFQYREFHLHTEVVINIPAIAYVFLSSFTCLTIVSKSLIANQSIDRIWQHLANIENLYNLHHERFLDFQEFYRQYFLDIFLVAFCHIQHVTVRATFNYGIHDVIVKMLTLFLFTIVLISIFHIIFYVRLLVFMLGELNKHILDENRVENRIFYTIVEKQRTLIESIKYVKRMHILLYDISVMINQYFGWILVTSFMVNSFDSVHTAFWFIWYLDRNSSMALEKAKLLSNYIIIN